MGTIWRHGKEGESRHLRRNLQLSPKKMSRSGAELSSGRGDRREERLTT